MLTRSKIIAAVAAATVGLASPAFAQTFSRSYGSGNVTPSYYDSEGSLHAGVAPQQNQQIAVQRNGLNAFASVPRGASGAEDPASTGGGSAGYNENLRTDQ